MPAGYAFTPMEMERERDVVPRDDPYAPPLAAAEAGTAGSPLPGWLRSYLSPSGSFSRLELLGATIFLGGLALLLNWLSPVAGLYLKFALYPIWGAALGKRSRDLGTTFTYGMVVGMLFPLIGLVFLFQRGRK